MSRHSITKKDYLTVLVLRTIGNFLILSSLFIIGKTFYQPVIQEFRYFINSQLGKKYIVAPDGITQTFKRNYSAKLGEDNGFARLFNLKKVEILTPEDPNFSIVIPQIGANARVIPNVSAVEENIYLEALKQGVAHAQGTAFPGEGGHIFLFAHSTDYLWNVSSYNAVFYLLYKLASSDEINIFYKGQRYIYLVVDKKIVDPQEVEYLVRKTPNEFLTLQTCWPPGTTLKRLLIFAQRKSQ